VLAKVTGNFQALKRDQLSATKGELLEVLNSAQQWWVVRNRHGELGKFPKNYLQLVQDRGDGGAWQQQQQQQQPPRQQHGRVSPSALSDVSSTYSTDSAATTDGTAALPFPWTKELDPSTGVPYYFNAVSGAASWVNPTQTPVWSGQPAGDLHRQPAGGQVDTGTDTGTGTSTSAGAESGNGPSATTRLAIPKSTLPEVAAAPTTVAKVTLTRQDRKGFGFSFKTHGGAHYVNMRNSEAEGSGLLHNDRLVQINGSVVLASWSHTEVKAKLQASPPRLVLVVERFA
jgi:hypothetical protein